MRPPRSSISAHALQNDLSAVLQRVEAGERLTITVSGRPVAELAPIDVRPRFVGWEEFASWPKADPGLADELREMFPDTTDDLPWRE